MTQPAKCPDCNHIYDFKKVGFSSNLVDDDIVEIGIICPNCQTWFHSHFRNQQLTQMGENMHNRKQRRAYEAEFKRFNKKMRKKFGLRKVNGRWVKLEAVNNG